MSEEQQLPSPEMEQVILDGVKDIKAVMTRVRELTAALPGVERRTAEVAVWTTMSLVVSERIWERAVDGGGSDPEKVISRVERYVQGLVKSILNAAPRFMPQVKDPSQ